MIIDRKIYPLHLAISRNWKVHYFRADMAQSAEHRAKDAAFLTDIDNFVGARGMAGLQRINAALDLDYGGIDFAINADGDILLFEANATMVMVPLTNDPKWDYRRPAFENVFTAIRSMLQRAVAGLGSQNSRVTDCRDLPRCRLIIARARHRSFCLFFNQSLCLDCRGLPAQIIVVLNCAVISK